MEQRRQADKDINEIKLSIVKIEGVLDTLSVATKEQHDRCDKQCDKLDKIFNDNGNRGLMTRVNSLEQTRKTQPTTRQAMLFGSVGGGISAFFAWILSKVIGV